MNNTTKHTPGPWRKGVDNTIYQAETNKRIADIYMHAIYRDSDMQAHANARLIAAAPAMYEALVETMKVLRSLRDNKEEWYTLVTPELLTAWDKNKAALAQAEGTNR